MGRLTKAQKLMPIEEGKRKIADEWLVTIGNCHAEIMEACRVNALKTGREWDEDIFSETILLCHESICRNGLRDATVNGCKNYLFQAYKMNVLHERRKPWNSRVTRDETMIDLNVAHEGSSSKVEMELWADYVAFRVLALAEGNVDMVSLYCFRLKYLVRGMSFNKLVKLTGIRNAKARVKRVMAFIRENIDEDSLRDEFAEYVEKMGATRYNKNEEDKE